MSRRLPWWAVAGGVGSGLAAVALASSSEAAGDASKGSGERYHIAKFDWDHVSAPYTISLWILLASLAKIGFHLSKRFASIFPDSSLLIVLGLVVGIILYLGNLSEELFHLESEIFFLYLLPPIVFDAGYFMPNRAFFDNLGSILCYAVVGTLWNTSTIGLSLFAVGQAGVFTVQTPLLHVLLFASLISAVDPVAVLVVFEQIHVNEVLFIIVFGESLLNDAVTVVLYKMFQGFSEIGAPNIQGVDIASGLISFFVVGLGGVLIGLVWAAVVSFTTRWTKHVRVLEPLFVFIMAYASYLTAEMFHLSGILAIVFCGIAMKQYVEGNVSQKSQTTIKYFLKMLSSSSETIIFMFLGLSTVSTSHHWDTAFVGLTVLFCLVYRAIGTVIQTFFVNKFRLIKLNKVDQFIMAYGGLRGAIAYGLVVALDEKLIPAKKMFITACIVVIYFTVFLQGMTIKPLVNFLKVKKDEKRDKTMNEQIFDRMNDHMTAGMECVMGQRGHDWLRDRYEWYNTHYLMPLLMREAPLTTDADIIQVYTKLTMKDAMSNLESFGTFGPGLGDAVTTRTLLAAAPGGKDILTDDKAAYTNPVFSVGGRGPDSDTPDSDNSSDDSEQVSVRPLPLAVRERRGKAAHHRTRDYPKNVSFGQAQPAAHGPTPPPPYDPDRSSPPLTAAEATLPWKTASPEKPRKVTTHFFQSSLSLSQPEPSPPQRRKVSEAEMGSRALFEARGWDSDRPSTSSAGSSRSSPRTPPTDTADVVRESPDDQRF